MGKKLLMLLGAFLVIYLLNFSIPRLIPGDPFDYTSGAAGDDVDAAYSEEQKELLRAYYGLDKPFFPQLRDTIVDNLHGDFGQSIHYKRPVADILLERLPWSLWIMGSTLALSLLLGVALALLCVRRPWADRALYPALSALLIYGVVTIVSFFLRDSRQGSFVFELFLGIVAAALGLLFLLRPVIVASVLPVILGLFIVVDGLVNLKRALELRRMLYLRWTVPLVLSAVSAVLGLVIVFQPFLAAEALVMLIGAVLIYEGLSDLWTIFRVSQWTKEYRKHHPVDVDQIDFE